MDYPFWDTGIGYGIWMAGIAVFHVFISHFAVGGGLYLVIGEHAARRSNEPARLDFLRSLSKFFLLVTLVSGTLTGVGIWFVIGLLNPVATEMLIHNFVWIWAIEWTFFAVEITAVIVYFQGWDRMSARNHLAVGWIYFIFAWLSLFAINGIITFMLTPGKWLATGNLRDGFFNPTFWQSLVLRTGICIMLAGLFALLVASRLKPGDCKGRIVRHSTAWGMAGLIVAILSNYWYWKAIPAQITSIAVQSMPTPMRAIQYSEWFAAGIGALLLIYGLLLPRRISLAVASALMLLGLGWVGSFEWFRESIRKPYIISGYMYGNALEVSRAANYRSQGLLSNISYRTGQDGADLFRHACRSCHTLRGYKGIRPAFEGTDRAFIASIVKAATLLKGNMPPFPGTAAEADLLAGYIEYQLSSKTLSESPGLRGIELGRRVYDIRCGKCHARGTSSDKTPSLAGMSKEDLENILNSAADLGDGMPAFTADSVDRTALIEYLVTLSNGGKK
jgi:mono/diheme cytochrome c family protein